MTLKNNLSANFIGQIWSALMGLAFVPLYIKYLGIESYGMVGLFAVLWSFFSVLDMGLTPTLSREMARFTAGEHSPESIRNLLRTFEVIVVIISAVITIGIVISSPWIVKLWVKTESLSSDMLERSVTIMGFIAGFRFIEIIYKSSLVGLQQQVILNVLNSILATIRAVGAIGVLACVSPTLDSFFYWQAINSLFTLLVFNFMVYRLIPIGSIKGEFSFSCLRSVWRFAGGMLCISLLGLLLSQLDKLILSKFLTLSDFGYYSLASLVASTIGMLVGPVVQAWYPHLCELHVKDDKESLSRSFHLGAQLISVLVGTVAVILIIFSQTLLELWTQDSNLSHKTAHFVVLLSLGNLLNAMLWIPYQTQIAHGWSTLAVQMNLFSVVFITPIIFWATLDYGAVGAAWGWIGLNLCQLIIGEHFMFRRILIGEKWNWYLKDLVAPVGSSFFVAYVLKINWGVAITTWDKLFELVVISLITLLVAVLSANQIRTLVIRKFLLYLIRVFDTKFKN
jgi:O-antigen/teichoic acid export membrane protein